MLQAADLIKDEITAWRREFHQNPELGFQEVQTARRVADILESIGCRVQRNIGRTGVIADMGTGAPLLAIRADMDALPLQEANDVPYASQIAGVMHACGHDAHTAILLGTARLLSQKEFKGSVRFVFQPAEEVGDEEGISGAPRMIEDGAMQGVQGNLALHVDASLPVGCISLEDGPNSAGVDTFYASIIGKGGHGASPHKAIDPIYIAGHVILALHGIVSRRLHPCEPAVVSICSIHAGGASNVIPDRVEISGTIRFMEESVRKQIHQEIKNALQVARSLGGDYELELEIGYPPMHNDPGMVSLIREVAVGLLGTEQVRIPPKEMGSEDFGFFCEHAPGAMFYLGALLEGDERHHHSPTFDIDERCLPVGTALLAQTALHFLEKN